MPVRRHVNLISTNISAIGYCQHDRIAEIIFITAPQYIYRYKNVPPEEFLDLMNAESVGSEWGMVYRKKWTNFTKIQRVTETPIPELEHVTHDGEEIPLPAKPKKKMEPPPIKKPKW